MFQRDSFMTQLRIEVLFNRYFLSDVTFIVGREQKRIPAHKFILSIGSPVFYSMLHGGFATTQNEIKVPDIEP